MWNMAKRKEESQVKRIESKIFSLPSIFFQPKNRPENGLKLHFRQLVNIISIIQQAKIGLKRGPQAPNKGLKSGAPSPHLLPNENLTFFISGPCGGGFVI